MKLAIFHSFLDNIGGAEIVSLVLAQALGADLYTTNIDWEKIKKMGFANVAIKSIGRVPINSPLRHQLTLAKFRRLNLKKDYDFFIIAGDWAVSAAVNNRPNIWYTHSVMKEIWDLASLTRKNNVPRLLGPLFIGWTKLNRKLVIRYANSVDAIVTNSSGTSSRAKQFLGREADIIYPPVNIQKYHYKTNGDFWLSVNRLINHKRIELQLAAFAQLPGERLVVVGSYERAFHFKKYARHLSKIKPVNVDIINWVDEAKLLDLYANCKGFITTSLGEDFGLAAVEAMAAGKPVIAPRQGGYQETVIDGRCGKLLDVVDVQTIKQAVREVGVSPSKYRDVCIDQAKKFSQDIFIQKIKQKVEYVQGIGK